MKEKWKRKQLRNIPHVAVWDCSRVALWKEPRPAGSHGGVGREWELLGPGALMPKLNIGDGADGVIRTLKTTLGEHEQSHALCVPQGACSWEQGGKPEAFAQPEV